MNNSQKGEPRRVAVVGAGSWGTALAYHLAGKGLGVDLWVYEPEVAEQIRTRRENTTYLPEVKLPEAVNPLTSLEEAVKGQAVVLLVVP
ncbi:MAG: NAD(P)-binding domain-containing protein, partial [Thermodesulfobacteriota bacterium]|nr:NAD(P)-binding domain-containing protein [Thermodesulfobacteriota bacterium]